VLKDPRICRLIPFWLSILDDFGAEPHAIIPIRHPLEVAASLKKRDGFVKAKSLLLWLQHFLLAERDTRHLPRSFVLYDNLLRDWQDTAAKIESDLQIVLPRRSHQATVEIEEFLQTELRHHQQPLDSLSQRQEIVQWVTEAFDWGVRASRGEAVDPEMLAPLYAAFQEADRAFGPVVAQQRLELGRLHEQVEHLHQGTADYEQKVAYLSQTLANREFELNHLVEQKNQDIAQLSAQLQHLTEQKEQETAQLSAQLQHLTEQKEQDIAQLSAQLQHLTEQKEQETAQLREHTNRLEAGLSRRDRRITALEQEAFDQRLNFEQTLSQSQQVYAQEIARESQSLELMKKLYRYQSSRRGVAKWKQTRQRRKTYQRLAASGLFDANYYQQTYPDVAAAGVDPLEHFIDRYYEGRNPNPDFDTVFYLCTYDDVAQSGMNPLLHYVLYGRQEGRLTKASS
jgi:hypothetical protein